MENAGGGKERYEEKEHNDKEVVESEESNTASGRDQQWASEHIYEKPHEITYPSLPAENIYDTGTGRSEILPRKR